jgi:hypothetical protein
VRATGVPLADAFTTTPTVSACDPKELSVESPSPRRFLALLATFFLLVSSELPLAGQDGDIPPAEPETPTDETPGAEPGDGKESIPPIPSWEPIDPELKELYAAGRLDLDEQRFSEAERAFKKMRSRVKGTDGEAAVARCLLEAEGGQLCEKAGKFRDKGQHRKIVALWVKNEEEFAATFTGAELKRYHDEAMALIFHTLADFEKKEGEEEKTEEPDPDSPEGMMRRMGLGGGGYGANTRVVHGTPESGKVRRGASALRWQLTDNLGIVSFEIPEEIELEEYRYLRISLRTEGRGSEPPIRVVFDCEDTPVMGIPGGGGGRGGRGGFGRGNAWIVSAVQNRVGFHGDLEPGFAWKDLRIDLRKLDGRGDPRWASVLNLRLVHLGVGEGVVLIDDVILERE